MSCVCGQVWPLTSAPGQYSHVAWGSGREECWWPDTSSVVVVFFFCTLEEHKVLCDVFAFHPGESNSLLFSVTLHFSHYSKLFLILNYTLSAPHRRDDCLPSPKSRNRGHPSGELGVNSRRSPWGHALSLKCDTLAEYQDNTLRLLTTPILKNPSFSLLTHSNPLVLIWSCWQLDRWLVEDKTFWLRNTHTHTHTHLYRLAHTPTLFLASPMCAVHIMYKSDASVSSVCFECDCCQERHLITTINTNTCLCVKSRKTFLTAQVTVLSRPAVNKILSL